ncbi:MAG TPA: Crp/Fnr family transcriptional regulator [Bryobacteraceae bacterium]|nr:Crp/Fnr family transcriptional regulator [Bryobacteraceae bacterium]
MDKPAALGRTVLFGNLNPQELQELAALAHTRELAQGEMLFLAGEPAAGLFVIASGRIRAFRVNAQGREQTIHIEQEGATLAEVPVFDDGVYPATATAEQPSTVLFLEKGDVRRFMLAHPAVGLTALKLMAARLRGHAELVDALALQQVGQRLARLLLSEGRARGQRTAAGVEFDLTLSNTELAKRVGSVREVVSRTLTRLERQGLIAQPKGSNKGRRRLAITDETGLARYAEEETRDG